MVSRPSHLHNDISKTEKITSLYWFGHLDMNHMAKHGIPDSKVHGTNMGPIWGRQDPGGPHVGPMNFASWVVAFMKGVITLSYWLLDILQSNKTHIPSGFVWFIRSSLDSHNGRCSLIWLYHISPCIMHPAMYNKWFNYGVLIIAFIRQINLWYVDLHEIVRCYSVHKLSLVHRSHCDLDVHHNKLLINEDTRQPLCWTWLR